MLVGARVRYSIFTLPFTYINLFLYFYLIFSKFNQKYFSFFRRIRREKEELRRDINDKDRQIEDIKRRIAQLEASKHKL